MLAESRVWLLLREERGWTGRQLKQSMVPLTLNPWIWHLSNWTNSPLLSSVHLWVSHVWKIISPVSQVSPEYIWRGATHPSILNQQLSFEWVQWFISDWQLWPNFSSHQHLGLSVSRQAKATPCSDSESMFSPKKIFSNSLLSSLFRSLTSHLQKSLYQVWDAKVKRPCFIPVPALMFFTEQTPL